MTKHFVKQQLETSDLFIESIDESKQTITYHVRTPDGTRLEPTHVSKYTVDGQRVNFDNRWLSLANFVRIASLLNDTN